MFRSNSFRRRLSVRVRNHALTVKIARNNDRSTYLFMLVLFTGGFVWFLNLFARPLFHLPFSPDELYLFPLLAFIVFWYVGGIRLAIWRLFGVEDLIIDKDVMHWTRRALFWVRKAEVPTKEITEVKAVTPWHALSNRVELTMLGKRKTIGDMLLRDEAIELSEKLREAVGLSEQRPSSAPK